MKLFQIDLDNVGYDTYDSCIIAANSKEEVEEMCRKNKFPVEDSFGVNFYISEDYRQGFTVTEIKLEDIKEPIILCSSYNAG